MRALTTAVLTTCTACALLAGGIAKSYAQERVLPAREGTQWYPYVEWKLENSSRDGNPFDIEARAVFIHEETGQIVTASLFYDGGDTWVLRFTGTLTGQWSVRTVSADLDLDGWTADFTVRTNPNPRSHGFIKAFGSKWGWQGTETAFVPQYVMGRNVRAYLDVDGGVDTAKIDADIREFVEEHGFTGFHLKGEDAWFDGENPDPRFFHALETLIANVHEHGGACHIWLWGSGGTGGEGDGGPERIAGGALSEMDRRNLRYIAARLGPVPGWSMGYGYDTENGWATVEELDAWKTFLERRLGWDHFLGARVGFDEKGLWAVRPRLSRPSHDAGFRSPISDDNTFWLGGDYTGYTSYRPLYPRYVQALYHHPERPSFEEDRFRLRDSEEWSYKDYSEELTRRGLWHAALAGGVANIWGNLLPTDDEGGSRPYAIKDQIKTYARFFEERFLKDMHTVYEGPELRLTTPDGMHTVIYREDTDLVRLDLTRMQAGLPAVAVDARAPYREIEIGRLSAEKHTWTAPYRSDWAVAVGSFSRLAPPQSTD